MTEVANHIQGKVVLITGGGSGFGRLTAELAAQHGARVVVSDVSAESAAATAGTIKAAGGEAIAIAADVVDKDQMDAAAALAVATFGGIDVLVNNAGVMPLAFFADHAVAWEAWDRAIDINLKGVVRGICAVYDQMIGQGRGHIVNVSSIYGNQGVAGAGVYGATKAAVGALSDALRVESQGKIKVTVIRPTGVQGTNLAASVVNFDAIVGLAGHHAPVYLDTITRWSTGELTAEEQDLNDTQYWTLSPEDLAGQIVAVINTPWGLNISDITVRSSGENFVI